jgi:predicted lipid-binding transport protein (Tim44 family)
MGDGTYLDIVLFAMVAGFILLRLRAVLGRRTGTEKPRDLPPLAKPAAKPEPARREDAVVPLPRREAAPVTGDQGRAIPGLDALRRADPGFDPDGFLEGARAAYEMIVLAFARGDTAALKPLLGDQVYRGFEQAIEARRRAGQSMETTLVGLDKVEIEQIRLDGSIAEVTLRYAATLINITRDTDGKVVEGDPSTPRTVTDIWTFARDTRSRDPNWQLVRTGAEA